MSLAGSTLAERSTLVAATLAAWRAAGTFTVLEGWRNELYTVYAPSAQPFLNMERSACALFGVVTYGVSAPASLPFPPSPSSFKTDAGQVHMTTYTLGPDGAISIWTPRRNPAKETYGGMLDNTVAGGVPAGLTALETLVKESAEEASLPESLVRANARPVGSVSYFYLRHKSAGGEEGLLQPEVEYCYDMLVDADVVPAPGDDEVQEFQLWGVARVQEELARGGFKPNCGIGAYTN